MFEYPGFDVIGQHRCDRLRWKGMFIDAERTPGQPASGDGLFWCHKTQNCLGPDGKPVNEYECSPGRDCYSPL